jgi:cytochrome c2
MKCIKTAAIFAALFLAVSTAQGFDPEAGDGDKGKEDIKKCRECHDGSKTDKLNPSSKTKKQWGRYFKDDQKKLKKKHADWDSLAYSTDLLQNVHRYLNGAALDSDKPQTCD